MGMIRNRSIRPRVIVASAGVGAGHNQAAHALVAGLTKRDPSCQVEWVDVLEYIPPAFRLYYAGGYALAVGNFPRCYDLGFRITDRPRSARRTWFERRRLWVQWHMMRRFRRWLETRLPAVVVHTHFLAPPVVGRMRAEGVGGLRQVVVVKDLGLHRRWYSEGVDGWFVGTEAARDRLIAFGVEADRIEQTGPPVHPKFDTAMDAATIRAKWNLPADRKMVLVSGGVDFAVGRVDRLAVDLCRRLPEAVVVVLAGRNKHIMARLARRDEAQGHVPQLRVLGFTDRVHELMSVADLVVTKAGGITVSECIASGVGMVLTRPVGGQEAFNARTLCDRGVAVIARSRKDVIDRVEHLLTTPAPPVQLRREARHAKQPGTEAIVGRILEMIDTGEPSDRPRA